MYKLLPKNKKYIILSILILIISGLFVFSIDSYDKYKSDKLAQVDEEKQEEIQKEKNKQEELDKLKEEIESLKNRPPQTIIQNIAPKPNEDIAPSLATVVKGWTPRVAQITCKYALLPGTANSLPKYGISRDPQYGAGSGFLMKIDSQDYDSGEIKQQVVVITNRHVLTGHNGFSPVDTCTVKIGQYSYKINGLSSGEKDIGTNRLHYYTEGFLDTEVMFIDGEPYSISDPDAGYLVIKNPDIEIKRLATEPARCSSKPPIGEDIVILGFPAIGATQSITATNGIISGFDQKYYVTSAKIDQGNSGGAAFWVKENCYIGIPTFAFTGEIESLARILDMAYIFGN